MSRSLVCLVGFFILLGCSNSDDGASDDLAAMQQVEIENFIAENSLDATRDDAGFYYIVEKDSSGGKDQSSGDVLSIYYSMRILGGEEISFFREENGDPLKLRQGVGAVVPIGLDDGLRRMAEGEIFRLILPSELAFGDLEFSTLIPANSIIDIEVELVKIESVADIEQLESDAIEAYIGDNNLNNLTTNPTDSVRVTGSGLRFKRTATVDDGQSPSSGDAVSITFTGKFLNDTQFDATTGNESFEFTLGSGEILSGLEEGVGEMQRGERAMLILPSELGYGASVRVVPDFLITDMIERQVVPDYVNRVPPYMVLIFEVTLAQ